MTVVDFSTVTRAFVGNTEVRQIVFNGQTLWQRGRPPTLETVFSSPQSVTLTLDDVTVTFDGVLAYGTYLDGSYWISGAGSPVTWTRTGAAASGNRTTSTGAVVSTGVLPINGVMLNPGNRAEASGDVSTLALRQQRNFGFGAGGGRQGFDGYVASSNAPYSAALNVGHTGTLTTGTLVMAISKTSPPTSARTVLSKLVPWTVVSATPARNSFRPGTSASSKSSTMTLADVDMTRLPNIAVGGLAMPDYATSLAAAGRYQTWHATYNVLSRNVVADANSAPVYGGEFWRYTEAMLAMCYASWTPTQKREMAIKLIQHAIDIVARAEEGGIWQDNGGHCTARKAILTFAAHMTQSASLTAYLDYKALGPNNPSPPTPVGQSIWGDDTQHRIVWPVHISAPFSPRSYPYNTGMIGWPEWDGDATRRYITSSFLQTDGWNNVLDVTSTDVRRNNEYRGIIARVNAPAALALQLMGARARFNNTVFFDYLDRHMTLRVSVNRPLAGTTANDISPWVLAAWTRDRAGAGNVWTSANLNLPAPNITGLAASAAGVTLAQAGCETLNGSGSVFYVVTTSDTAPTAAQIIAGQTHTGSAAPSSGSVPVQQPGAVAITATGLSGTTTYYMHAVQRDFRNMIGTVMSSASFSTANAPTAPLAFVDADWRVEDMQASGTLRLTVIRLPATGGSAITSLQYRTNGGSWVTVATTLTSYSLTGLPNDTPSAVELRAVNAVGTGPSATKNVAPTADPATLIPLVTPQGTARATFTPGGTATKAEFSILVRQRSDFSGVHFLLRASLGATLQAGSTGVLTIGWWDSAGTQVFGATTPVNTVVRGRLHHIYLSYDFTTATPVVLVDGIAASLTITTAAASGTGFARPNRTHSLPTDAVTGPLVDITDYWLAYRDTLVGPTPFLRDNETGEFADLTGVGTPHVWCGGRMRANDRDGNAAQGWNDGFNQGSAVLTMVSATWADV